jgi:penicillin-binding protein 1A
MATALKNRPKLAFTPPPGVTLASWDSGYGTVTDAFKPDQIPGASSWAGGGSGGEQGGGGTVAAPQAGGVDTGLGGLY